MFWDFGFFLTMIHLLTFSDSMWMMTQSNSTLGSTSTHEFHVTWCQGEAPGALVSEGSTATRVLEAEARTEGEVQHFLEPWTTNRNWLKSSASSMREGMGC